MEGVGDWIAVALLAAGFVAASLVTIPCRSHRGWSLIAFAVLAGLVAGAPFLYLGVGVGAAAVVATTVRRGSSKPTRPLVDAAAAVVLLAGWGAVRAASPLFVGTTVSWRDLLLVAAVAVAWFAADSVLRVVTEPDANRGVRFLFARYWGDWPVAVVVLSLALLLGSLWDHSPLWSLMVSLVPLVLFVALLSSLLRHEEIEWATLRALGRLPEAAGNSLPGHSAGTARLAADMGRLSGYRGRDLEELEKAALLHDVGLVFCSTDEVRDAGFTQADVGRWSVGLVHAARGLPTVERLISGSIDWHRAPGCDPDPDIDMRSRILAVACRAQALVAGGMTAEQGITSLTAEARYRFAPTITELAGVCLSRDPSRYG